jgi:hypothetical protein
MPWSAIRSQALLGKDAATARPKISTSSTSSSGIEILSAPAMSWPVWALTC